MPTFADAVRGRDRKKHVRLHPSSHWAEQHWVYTRGSWEDGLAVLMKALPKEARTTRPAEWFALLRETHWPGCRPPGDGPFYLPEWAIDEERLQKAVRAAHFQAVQAHVAVLPDDSEALARAVRGAGGVAWNMDPILGRAYYYPGLKGYRKRYLRTYTIGGPGANPARSPDLR